MQVYKSLMRKLVVTIGVLVCLGLYSCSDITDHKTLFFAHSLPITHPVHKGILAMKEALNEKSGGKLQIKVFPDGQLGTEREVLELLQIGSVAMTKVSAAAMSSFAPEYRVLGVPYLFRDSEHMFNVLEGKVGQELLEGGSEYLLRGLCFYDAGSRSFYTLDGFIKTPEDLKGKKIRVMNDQMAVNMVNDLGGSATPMAYGELYTALQQRVVDGAENNVPSFVTSNHYEDTLSDTEKGWLQDAAVESVKKQKVYWKENVEEGMKVLKEANVEIYYPDKTPFVEKTKPILEELIKDPKMKKIIDQINNQ